MMQPEPAAETAHPPGVESQRFIPTPFLTKTHQLVDDKEIDDIISWSDDGSSFIVWNPMIFARDYLPKYFKHNNFSSFVRQLNTYGFRKVVPDRWEFSNDNFRRGEKQLMIDIQRRKASSSQPQTPSVAVPQEPPVPVIVPPPSTSSSDEEMLLSNTSSPSVPVNGGTNSELVEENSRLRKENVKLKKELSDTKGLVSNIYSMVSNHNASETEPGQETGVSMTDPKTLDLMAAGSSVLDEEDGATMLFGVSIGGKRGRDDEDDGTVVQFQ